MSHRSEILHSLIFQNCGETQMKIYTFDNTRQRLYTHAEDKFPCVLSLKMKKTIELRQCLNGYFAEISLKNKRCAILFLRIPDEKCLFVNFKTLKLSISFQKVIVHEAMFLTFIFICLSKYNLQTYVSCKCCNPLSISTVQSRTSISFRISSCFFALVITPCRVPPCQHSLAVFKNKISFSLC